MQKEYKVGRNVTPKDIEIVLNVTDLYGNHSRWYFHRFENDDGKDKKAVYTDKKEESEYFNKKT